MNSFLFSGYARLPQDVSHQALYKRVGVVVEVDRTGRVIRCTSTLIMDLARDFLNRLLSGRSVLTERAEIEQLVRYYYRGHSQSALIFALRKVFEAVDQSPLVLGDTVEAPPGADVVTAQPADAPSAGQHVQAGRAKSRQN